MKKQVLSSLLAAAVALTCVACSPSQTTAEKEGTLISLSDDAITVDGEAVSTEETAAVYTGAEIVYYKDGTDESYGEGEDHEKHSAEEAAAHRVVTITRPGTYRLTGSLSQGQIAVDLGEEAAEDPEAVVTLILDNVDVKCTVAPALIFYNVYECGVVDAETASATVDTSAAGANVVIAAGSENTFTGSHVARIYQEGTTKKLHKYDGAFYSKTSMNIYGDNGDDSGILYIVSDNEGLNSELHLTIHGGTINISSQDDGINTNEDFVSVTTINGGDLTIHAGQGAEGDGIDSNGYLTINGGTIITTANERTPDGGIDADCAITINGGTLYAFGTRNDAVDSASVQPYMELSFASTLPAGSAIKVTDTEGSILWGLVTSQSCQSITLTTPELKLDTVYHVYVDDVLQSYSGNSFGMMGGGRQPGGQTPEGMEPPEGFDPEQMMPEGFEPGQRPEGELPEDGQRPEAEGRPGGMMDRPEMDIYEVIDQIPEEMLPEGYTRDELKAMGEEELRELYNGVMPFLPPEGFEPGMLPGGEGLAPGFPGMGGQGDGSVSTEFILTETTKSFSGVCDSDASGKIRVTFTVEGMERDGRDTVLPAVTAISSSVELDLSQVQITVTDVPSEDYSMSCTWEAGLDAVNELLPTDPGSYQLTVAVVSGNEEYTGATQLSFVVPEETAEDVS